MLRRRESRAFVDRRCPGPMIGWPIEAGRRAARRTPATTRARSGRHAPRRTPCRLADELRAARPSATSSSGTSRCPMKKIASTLLRLGPPLAADPSVFFGAFAMMFESVRMKVSHSARLVAEPLDDGKRMADTDSCCACPLRVSAQARTRLARRARRRPRPPARPARCALRQPAACPLPSGAAPGAPACCGGCCGRRAQPCRCHRADVRTGCVACPVPLASRRDAVITSADATISSGSGVTSVLPWQYRNRPRCRTGRRIIRSLDGSLANSDRQRRTRPTSGFAATTSRR